MAVAEFLTMTFALIANFPPGLTFLVIPFTNTFGITPPLIVTVALAAAHRPEDNDVTLTLEEKL